MKNILQRVAREPNALVGVVIALYSALVVFDVFHPTAQQTGALGILGGSVVVLLRWLVTPTSEVVVQDKPGAPTLVAGPASTVPTGAPVRARVTELPEAA